jgi:hypothetical protein
LHGTTPFARLAVVFVALLACIGVVAVAYRPVSCVPNAPDACTTIDGVALGRLMTTLPARRPVADATRPDRDALAVAWEGLDALRPDHPGVTAVESYAWPPIDCGPGCPAAVPASIYLFRFADAPPLPVVVSCPGVGRCTAGAD